MTNEPRFKLEVVAPIFPVTDVRRAITYYAEALMFDIGFEWADSASEPIRYAVLQNGNTELHLTETDVWRETTAYFFVDGVRAYYDAVLEKEARITCEIKDHPWEMREFEVADPDGNRIVFGEHLSRIVPAAGATRPDTI